MIIREISDIEKIAPLHELVFGKEFPYESFYKKKSQYPVYIYAYFDGDFITGYSIIIDQKEDKNLYAWYGGLLPEYQGNGVTIDFFDIMIKRAKDMNYQSVTLATTNCRPHMLRLAIKYGFDIYDMKKRDYGEGNKIYFKYLILPESSIDIDIYPNLTRIKEVEVEKILVQAYKNNCQKIRITNIQSENDYKIVEYCIRYCNSFIHKPIIETDCEDKRIQSMLRAYNN